MAQENLPAQTVALQQLAAVDIAESLVDPAPTRAELTPILSTTPNGPNLSDIHDEPATPTKKTLGLSLSPGLASPQPSPMMQTPTRLVSSTTSFTTPPLRSQGRGIVRCSESSTAIDPTTQRKGEMIFCSPPPVLSLPPYEVIKGVHKDELQANLDDSASSGSDEPPRNKMRGPLLVCPYCGTSKPGWTQMALNGHYTWCQAKKDAEARSSGGDKEESSENEDMTTTRVLAAHGSRWTVAAERQLYLACQKWGCSWVKIVHDPDFPLLAHRTENSIRQKYHKTKRKIWPNTIQTKTSTHAEVAQVAAQEAVRALSEENTDTPAPIDTPAPSAVAAPAAKALAAQSATSHTGEPEPKSAPPDKPMPLPKKWTTEEVDKIQEAVAKHGMDWVAIRADPKFALDFGNRSLDALRQKHSKVTIYKRIYAPTGEDPLRRNAFMKSLNAQASVPTEAPVVKFKSTKTTLKKKKRLTRTQPSKKAGWGGRGRKGNTKSKNKTDNQATGKESDDEDRVVDEIESALGDSESGQVIQPVIEPASQSKVEKVLPGHKSLHRPIWESDALQIGHMAIAVWEESSRPFVMLQVTSVEGEQLMGHIWTTKASLTGRYRVQDKEEIRLPISAIVTHGFSLTAIGQIPLKVLKVIHHSPKTRFKLVGAYLDRV